MAIVVINILFYSFCSFCYYLIFHILNNKKCEMKRTPTKHFSALFCWWNSPKISQLEAYCCLILLFRLCINRWRLLLIFIVSSVSQSHCVCHSVRRWWKGVNFSINELNNNGWIIIKKKYYEHHHVASCMHFQWDAFLFDVFVVGIAFAVIFSPRFKHTHSLTSQVNDDDHDNGQIIIIVILKCVYTCVYHLSLWS